MLQLTSDDDNREKQLLDESSCRSLYLNQLKELPAQRTLFWLKQILSASGRKFRKMHFLLASRLFLSCISACLLWIVLFQTQNSHESDYQKEFSFSKRIWKLTFLHIVQQAEQKSLWEVQHAKRQCFYPGTTGIE